MTERISKLNSYNKVAAWYKAAKPLGWAPYQYVSHIATPEHAPTVQVYLYGCQQVVIRELMTRKWEIWTIPPGTPIYSHQENAEIEFLKLSQRAQGESVL
jgi:hypothetical protein